MDVDPLEYVEQEDEEAPDARREQEARTKSRLNTLVAVTVALIATFMGICSVKAGNISQQMQQNQAEKIDNWSFYQARNIRETIYDSTADQLRAMAEAAAPSAKAAYLKQAETYTKRAREQETKKAEQRADAEKAEKDYERWNLHDDQFDLSEALLSLAIALLATTALTGKRGLFILAMVPTCFGILMGLAGLFQWQIHWQWAAKALGT